MPGSPQSRLAGRAQRAAAWFAGRVIFTTRDLSKLPPPERAGVEPARDAAGTCVRPRRSGAL